MLRVNFQRPLEFAIWSLRVRLPSKPDSLPAMSVKTVSGHGGDAVVQFSVFTPNRVGRLHEVVQLLASRKVHVLALTVLDTTDSSILRLVVDDPDRARDLWQEHAFAFTESSLVAVEMSSPQELTRLMAALLSAELNIHYLYSFLTSPGGKSILGLSMDDNELAEQVLKRHQFVLLKQSDISR